jgi:aminomethyltransferase
MVPFGGWDMPVQYSDGIIAEVKSVRNSAGMFDVSHMGRVYFEGSGAAYFLGTILSANIPALKIGRGKYNFICNTEGGVIDDAMVYRVSEEKYMLVVNAGNYDVDIEWITPRLESASDVTMLDVTSDTAMVAVQGPNAVEIIDKLTGDEASGIRRFRIGQAKLLGENATLCRTGYTGEDGFEVIVPAGKAEELWTTLKSAGAVECGLGSRDVLRLEAGLPLHGNDLSTDTNPFEAGFGRFAYFQGENYVAANALMHFAESEPTRRLVGLKMVGRGIPRTGLNVLSVTDPDKKIGEVTSGTHSPTVDAAIGLGYVDQNSAEIGTRILIDVRGRQVEAEIVELPFYRRQ